MMDKEQSTLTKESIPLIDKSSKNSRNMPSIIFIENVVDFAERYGHDNLVEEVNVFYR